MKSVSINSAAILCAGVLAASAAYAEDGPSFGIGVDYSSGDYGTDTTTEITSVPLTFKYNSGNWTWKASVPWMRIDGDASVVPGLGNVGNSNPRGRGRGGNTAPTGTETGSASGIGDLRLAATYAFNTEGAVGVDLTANAKIATADEDKGLGTGQNDYGIALDLYGDVGGTTVFGGVSHTMLGDSEFIDADSVWGANAGLSWAVGEANSLGVMYDWREAATSTSDDRSEITGFYSVKASEASKWQVYATKGLSDGSPDWGGGVSFSHAF